MATEVILPKVDMDMATGRIARWLVAEGAAVKQGEPLFEIETDKATMEIESPASGVLRNVIARKGADVPVGQPVAWIYAEGETADAPVRTARPQPEARPAPAAPVLQAVVPVESARAVGGNGLRATPFARRRAREAGIDLKTIAGTGPNGRILRADIEEAVAARAAAAKARSAAPAPPAAEDAVRGLFATGTFIETPHDSMRLAIARRLAAAKATIPHFYLGCDCRLDALLKLRADLNAAAPPVKGEGPPQPAYRLSLNDLIIKAWAHALSAVPAANVTWTDGALLTHAHADIGVAVSVPGGLITPVIRRAETKSLSVISGEMKDLAARARSRKLKPEEYQGGTSAISNLGMFGVTEFAAIINPPHATILAVGAGEERAVVEKGQCVPATVMTVTLSADHRAVDGALGAQALQAFRTFIECPVTMLV